MEDNSKTHESYGQIKVSKFTGNGVEYFGSDIIHNGGISLEISRCSVETKYNSKYYYQEKPLIRVQMSNSQYVDMITSAMNTAGVPCTLIQTEGGMVPQISHVEDKVETFKRSIEDTQLEYGNRIDSIIEKLSTGTLGKKKVAELIKDLGILQSHIKSNTPFVMDRFEKQMEDTIIEAKQSISLYVDTKVQAMGIESLRDELMVKIESKEEKK